MGQENGCHPHSPCFIKLNNSTLTGPFPDVCYFPTHKIEVREGPRRRQSAEDVVRYRERALYSIVGLSLLLLRSGERRRKRERDRKEGTLVAAREGKKIEAASAAPFPPSCYSQTPPSLFRGKQGRRGEKKRSRQPRRKRTRKGGWRRLRRRRPTAAAAAQPLSFEQKKKSKGSSGGRRQG